MTEYSGRTTAHGHKREDWRDFKCAIPPSLKQVTVFEVQWSDCPVEVAAEVTKLWKWAELQNDSTYYSWQSGAEYWDERHEASSDMKMSDGFPLIDEYLKSMGITDCLIHWWW